MHRSIKPLKRKTTSWKLWCWVTVLWARPQLFRTIFARISHRFISQRLAQTSIARGWKSWIMTNWNQWHYRFGIQQVKRDFSPLVELSIGELRPVFLFTTLPIRNPSKTSRYGSRSFWWKQCPKTLTSSPSLYSATKLIEWMIVRWVKTRWSHGSKRTQTSFITKCRPWTVAMWTKPLVK